MKLYNKYSPLAQITKDAIQQNKKPWKPVRAKKPKEGFLTQCTRCTTSKISAQHVMQLEWQHKECHSSKCFTKPVVATVTSQEHDNNSFLFLGTRTNTPSTWLASLKKRGKEIASKVDTGAAVMVILK